MSNCCGSCGYALNLSSSNRNTSAISSKYGKSMKRGIISFLSIDESRFIQKEEFQCLPFFLSNDSWGLFRRRTKLLCRKCGNRVGTAYEDNTSFDSVGSDVLDSSSGKETSTRRKFDIKIRALQPSSEESGVPLVM
ncbi:nitrate reductase [NAD(P)H]-like isoform X1 [Thalictrum thalictroides]|uniref:Nitrate reductase [NAD(P)H]-like isoform X1 n=1 Tax=Thalictrum thalictroides TaxID=46969 RepID=A0A7J6V7M7_THATH|nr:nitrate reductase [NAD(P)H]-like isoform X1 [Thalictrum thalictroides]